MTTSVKLVAGLVAIFAAGVVVGGSLGFKIAKSNPPKPVAEQPRRTTNSNNGDFATRVCSKLQRDLNLTEEQLTQIKPIYEQTSAQLKTVHAENYERVRAIFRASREKMKPFLTPEQIQKLEQRDREREGKLKKSASEKPKC